MKTLKVKNALLGLITVLAVAVALVSCKEESLLEDVVTHSELIDNQEMIENLNADAGELLEEYYKNNPKDDSTEKKIPHSNDPNCHDVALTNICCMSYNGNQSCWYDPNDQQASTFIALSVTRQNSCNSSNYITPGSYARIALSGIPAGFRYKVDGYVNSWQTSNGGTSYFNINLPDQPSVNGTGIGVRLHIDGNGISVPTPTVNFSLVGTNSYNAIIPSSRSFQVVGC